jgi:hypothetical protein
MAQRSTNRMRMSGACGACGHTEDDHDGYGGMCDGLGDNASREVCGCVAFVTPSPEPRAAAPLVPESAGGQKP